MGINELQQGVNNMITSGKPKQMEVFEEDIHEQLVRNYINSIEDRVPNDPVHRPKHYTGHPSGIECIQITEHMGFNLGNAVKYIWRCDLKKDAIEDLKKAVWYIEREIKRRDAQ